MTGSPEDAIDVLLADGGHVIVAFADPAIETDPCGEAIVSDLVLCEGSEDELERAIVSRASQGGLEATVSASGNPTTIVIAIGEPRPRGR